MLQGSQIFQDRADAGRRLAARLGHYARRDDVLVLALPRGGVPIGAEVARAIGAELDVLIVRKLGVPGQPELAMGAIASGGIRVVNPDVLRQLGISADTVERVAALEQEELERRERLLRGGRPPPDLEGRTVIVVDDGIATGSTMLAAIQALRTRRPARLVVAAPVAAASTCRQIQTVVDEVACLSTPEPFAAVGFFYRQFPQVSDQSVRDILAEYSRRPSRDLPGRTFGSTGLS